MARKIFSWLLIILGGLFLFLSIAGMIAIWVYRTPLTNKATTQLKAIDAELAQAQTTLASSQKELERALRIVDNAQTVMDKLKQQTNSAGNLLDTIQSTLDDRLLPELKTTRGQITSARDTLTQLQSLLAGIKNFVPGVDLSAPDKILSDLIASANSLDAEISNVETLAQQASLFVSDTSYLLGGDLSETRTSLENFLAAIKDYETKVTHWREQIATLIAGTPRWINEASIVLTFFLLWFGVSQFGLVLHGLSMRRGEDPFRVLRRTKVEVRTDGAVKEEATDS
jgi:F0F1-type ATP synthase membrane subunit b/b'